MGSTENPTEFLPGDGIYNYFQGAIIYNMVINGNMTKNGSEIHHANTAEKQPPQYSEKQVARAIEAICGHDKPLNSKQLWAAVYWYLRWQCNYPVKGADFCERVNRLPFSRKLEYECDYNNIRRQTTLSFMQQDARQIEQVKPSRGDEAFFAQCRTVVLALARELEKKTVEEAVILPT